MAARRNKGWCRPVNMSTTWQMHINVHTLVQVFSGFKSLPRISVFTKRSESLGCSIAAGASFHITPNLDMRETLRLYKCELMTDGEKWKWVRACQSTWWTRLFTDSQLLDNWPAWPAPPPHNTCIQTDSQTLQSCGMLTTHWPPETQYQSQQLYISGGAKPSLHESKNKEACVCVSLCQLGKV